MNVYLAADHRGFELKEIIKDWLEDMEEFTVIDLGAKKYVQTDDYPDYGIALGEAVAADEGSRGIGLCGSGVGMMVAANKVKGIRAAPHRDAEIAAVGRSDDNTNVLVLAADYLEKKEALKITKLWLQTDYGSEARFERRINKITEYENRRD